MDAYLESLVKKEVKEVVVSESVEEVKEKSTEETKEEIVVEAVEAESVVEPEVVVKEDPKEKNSEAKKEKIKVKKEDPKKAEVKKEELKKDSKTQAPDPSFLEEGKEYDVDLIRVYKTPDTKQMSSTISGRVIFLGKIGTFSIINYMRHGFGLIKGYVEDLESRVK